MIFKIEIAFQISWGEFVLDLFFEFGEVSLFNAWVFDEQAGEAYVWVGLWKEGDAAASQPAVSVLVVLDEEQTPVEFDAVVLVLADGVVVCVAQRSHAAAARTDVEEIDWLEVTVGLEGRRFGEHVVGLERHPPVRARRQRARLVLVQCLGERLLHPSVRVAQHALD